MGLTLVKEQLDQSVAVLAAESVLTHLFSDLDHLNSPLAVDAEWFTQVVDLLTFSTTIKEGFGHARAYALAIIKQHWEEIGIDIRKQYGFSFDSFAHSATNKKASTINNYIRTAEVWFIQKINPGKQIEITTRDQEGKPIRDEKGRVITSWKDFTPYIIDLSKLLAVNARAASGTMTTKLWEMLIDDYYSCEDIQLEAAGKDGEKDFYRPSFFLLGPGLYVEVAGETKCIAEELNWEGYETDDYIHDAIDLMLKVLDVMNEEDRIREIQKESYNAI